MIFLKYFNICEKIIRVGRRIYSGNGFKDPEYENFIPIICMTPSTEYGSLSPYSLKDENGYILENIWQFSKLYEKVPHSIQKYSKYDPKIIWNHPEEIHVKNGKITNEYWNWRKKCFKNEYAIRYPVGYNDRSKCICALKDIGNNFYIELNYIEARKEIYVIEYEKSVVKQKKFRDLLNFLRKGINILIIEVDGPHEESLEYYQKKYNVNSDFIKKIQH